HRLYAKVGTYTSTPPMGPSASRVASFTSLIFSRLLDQPCRITASTCALPLRHSKKPSIIPVLPKLHNHSNNQIEHAEEAQRIELYTDYPKEPAAGMTPGLTPDFGKRSCSNDKRRPFG